jgi:hypothetical protein
MGLTKYQNILIDQHWIHYIKLKTEDNTRKRAKPHIEGILYSIHMQLAWNQHYIQQKLYIIHDFYFMNWIIHELN